VARAHEVPNHLNVQDTLFLGLTARQVATFMAFASPAYGIWDQLTIAPVPVRGTLAGLLVLAGIGFTLIQPGGRPLDEWAFALFAYFVTPVVVSKRARSTRVGSDCLCWLGGPRPSPRVGKRCFG
jgi:hypothetical protein